MFKRHHANTATKIRVLIGMVTLTWHARKYKVHSSKVHPQSLLHPQYVPLVEFMYLVEDVPRVEFMDLVLTCMPCGSYREDSGLCCCICVTSFKC